MKSIINQILYNPLFFQGIFSFSFFILVIFISKYVNFQKQSFALVKYNNELSLEFNNNIQQFISFRLVNEIFLQMKYILQQLEKKFFNLFYLSKRDIEDNNSLIDIIENLKKSLLICLLINLLFFIVVFIFISLYVQEKNKDKDKLNNTNSTKEEKEPLSLWNDFDSYGPKQILLDYIKTITDEHGKNYVPKEDRIAVFDFDGTLFQETDPIYCDHKLFMHRVFNDINYKDKATDKEKEAANKVKYYAEMGKQPPLEKKIAEAMAEVYKNMKVKEIYNYTKKYLAQPSDGYNNMKRGDAFYKPMLELVEYLQKNDFIIYIVTGTDTFICRAIIDGHINIPKNHIIGTETLIIADNQKDMDSIDYKYSRKDELIFKGQLVSKNTNMHKVYYIAKEIGKFPLLSFGNSGSDSSMAELSLQNPHGLAFMILCDDTERERGDLEKSKSFEESCIKNNYITISMRDDWKTIYGKDVTRKKILE
jgi:phosphoglycolate phosphatase-like HAD superfamily hydrolase